MTIDQPTTVASMTDTQTLRLAAQAMRDIAADATPGPWERHPGGSGIWRTGEERGRAPTLIVSGGAVWGPDADHICTWPPELAKLVAACLDAVADDAQALAENDGVDPHKAVGGYTQAVAVAAAYLGQAAKP